MRTSKDAGHVRIIGGEWRRRRLRIPRGATLRPTPDRVRETLFNWLAPHLAGARCLDLFAGTGALGFEALSRGALEAHFVESDARLAAALREHAAMLGANAAVWHDDAERWLEREPSTSFDLVFLDPPYARRLEPLVAALGPWLAPGAALYVERAAADDLPQLAGFRWRRRGRAGDVCYGVAERAPQ